MRYACGTPSSESFSSGLALTLMDYLWLIIAVAVWTVVQAWVLPRLGVPT